MSPFNEGREAYSDDKNLEDNPHDTEPNKSQWKAGWEQAAADDPLGDMIHLSESFDDDDDDDED